MIGTGGQAVHRVVSQACPQTFAQLLPGQGLLRALVEQLAPLRDEGRQVPRLQAEGAHWGRHLQLLQAPTGQFEEHGRLTLGTEQPHRHPGFRQVTVFQMEGEALHAAVTAGEERGQVGGETAQGEQQCLVGFHLEVQLDAQVELIRRPIALQRQGTLAQQGVEVLQYFARKAPGQRLPGQRQHLFQMPQAHAGEGSGGFPCQTGAIHRQAPEGGTQFILVRHRQAIVGIGQHPRRRRVGRRDDAMAKAQGRQLPPQAGLEARPGAEQGEAGFHLQQQAARIAQADLGTEAVGPGGQQLLPVLDPRRVVLHQGEVAGQGMGGGQRLAGPQPQRPGGGVEGTQHAALGRARHQRQGRFGVGVDAQHAIQRQLRQQYAGPAHDGITGTGRSAPRAADRPGT
ncbi:hypothetical protein D9M72_279330 [compost metagenome]